MGQVTLLPDLDERADERIDLTALRRVDENGMTVASEGVGGCETELLVIRGEGLLSLSAERRFPLDEARYKRLLAFEKGEPRGS